MGASSGNRCQRILGLAWYTLWGSPGSRRPAAPRPTRERRMQGSLVRLGRCRARRLERCSTRAAAHRCHEGDRWRRRRSRRTRAGGRAAPATRSAHLRPGRQERGSERQVSQKFPGLRCHGGRHLKQETRRGGAGLRADKGGGGKEEGGGGPRGPFPSARARPLPSAACCRLLPRARVGLAPGRGFPACAPPVGAAGQYFGPPTPTPSSP